MRKSTLFMCGLLLFYLGSFAQNRTVSGSVRDSIGQPLSQVSILATGTRIGTVTDNSGGFSISVPNTVTELTISYVGFETQRVRIPANGSLAIVLLQSANLTDLDAVIITGYTRERRSNFAGAVSKVGSRAINQVPLASIDQILQGRAPGLYATAGSGQPGTAANVIIRGIGSINGSTTPLYVVDGVPVSAGAFAALSASDIESVDVLKDAVSTALYGSRGANGVIVITTKRGRPNNKLTVGFKTQAGYSTRTQERFEMMNGAQRLQYEEEIGIDHGQNIGPGWTYSRKNPANANRTEATLQQYDQIVDSLRNMNVDWRDIFFRKAKFQEHEVNLSGGSERVSFYSAFNYFDQQGIALRSDLKRFSIRNNLDIRANRFTAAISSTLNFARMNFIESENTTAVSNPFASVYYALPYEQPYINGVLVHSGNGYGQNGSPFNVLDQREGSTALERALATTQKRDENKAVLGGNFRFKFTDYLAAISTVGVDYREIVGERFINPTMYTGTLTTGGRGSFAESMGRIYRLFGNAGLNFNNTFNSKHTIDASVLYEGIQSRTRNFNYTGYGLNPLLPNTPAAITPGSATGGFIPVVGGSRDLTGLNSLITIGKYVFDNKYTFNGSFRYDGSSQLPEDTRWKTFYSVGASWNVMREAFMKNSKILSELQLRASHGVAASPIIASFGYLATYSNARYDGQTGSAVANIANPAFDWEFSRTTNLGLDFSIFKRRLSGSVDVYRKNTENLFVSQQLSRTAGASSLDINAGTMRNTGIEVSLNSDIISTPSFRWNIGGNAAYNKNEIVDLGQVKEFELGTSIIRVGLPYGSHYLPKWAGVDAATGSPLYYNRDGSVTTIFNSATQSVAEFGSWLPDMQGGFNSGLNFKGAYIEAFFTFALGVDKFNNEDFFNETPSFATSNQSSRLLSRWRKPGDVTDIQRFSSSRSFSSKDIQDASYLRFRNLNVGYSLPASVLGRFNGKISAITLYAQAQNLFTWTQWRGFDPEDSNNISTFEYPNARTMTLGLNLSF